MPRRPLAVPSVVPLAATLCALLLAGCAQDPTAPASATPTAATVSSLRSATRSAAAVPLRGTLTASETGAYDPATARVRIRLEGTGTATHLGRYTLVSEIVLEPIFATADGTMTLTAADGSTLVASFTGVGIRLPNDIADITEVATITGGTGRFAGVSGQFTLVRRLDQSTGISSGTMDGMIRGVASKGAS